jgi:hypothetical protein
MPSPANSSTSAPVKGRLDVEAGVVDAAATVAGFVSGRAAVGVTAAGGATTAAVTVLTGGGVTDVPETTGGMAQPPGSVMDWETMHCAPATAGIANSEAAATHEPTTALLIHFIVSNFP